MFSHPHPVLHVCTNGVSGLTLQTASRSHRHTDGTGEREVKEGCRLVAAAGEDQEIALGKFLPPALLHHECVEASRLGPQQWKTFSSSDKPPPLPPYHHRRYLSTPPPLTSCFYTFSSVPRISAPLLYHPRCSPSALDELQPALPFATVTRYRPAVNLHRGDNNRCDELQQHFLSYTPFPETFLLI